MESNVTPSATGEDDGAAVVICAPERMNLLGLILARVLSRRLENEPAVRRHAARLHGPVVIDAGGMSATLRFSNGRIRVERGAAPRPRVRLEGSLAALVDAALGRRRLRHLARRELRVSGPPAELWRLLAVLRS